MAATATLVRSVRGSASLAFLGVVLLGGVNAVAVRISERAAGAAVGCDAPLRHCGGRPAAVVGLTRTPLPRGRALTGSILYGTVGFAGAFGSIHWALCGCRRPVPRPSSLWSRS